MNSLAFLASELNEELRAAFILSVRGNVQTVGDVINPNMDNIRQKDSPYGLPTTTVRTNFFKINSKETNTNSKKNV